VSESEFFSPHGVLLLTGAFVTFASTALGALPALATRRLTDVQRGALLGFSAGVMLSAAAFSLITPSFDLIRSQGLLGYSGAFVIGASVLMGAAFIAVLNRFLPHEHFETGIEGGIPATALKRVWLFVIAITLHNFPEGLAVGTGVGSEDISIALPILVGIGIQNLPEGFIVAFSLLAVGYRIREAFWVAILTGIVEAGSAVLGYIAVTTVSDFLPIALSAAGGAMIYVVSSEMIPESHSKSQSVYTSTGLMIGFVLMLVISALF